MAFLLLPFTPLSTQLCTSYRRRIYRDFGWMRSLFVAVINDPRSSDYNPGLGLHGK